MKAFDQARRRRSAPAVVRHLLVWLLAATLVAGAGGYLVAWAMGRALFSTVELVMGEAGRFDVLLQLQQERRREALAAASELLARQFPGSAVKEGPSAAGSTVLLVSLPERWRNARTFERLDRELAGVPGLVSWLPLVEPSVTVSRVHPALERDLQGWLERQEEVDFTFFRGSDLVVVLKEAGRLDRFNEKLKRRIGTYRVVRAVLPGQAVDAGLARRAAQALEEQGWAGSVVYAAPATEGAGAGTVRWVERMRDFFVSYATLARIEASEAARDTPLRVGEEVRVGGAPAQVVAFDGRQGLAVLAEESGAQDLLGKPVEVRRASGELAGTAVVDGGRIRIQAALDESEALLNRLEQAGGSWEEALHSAQQAARQLEQTIGRIEQAAEDLSRLSASSSDPARDTLVALALSVLLGRRDSTATPGDATRSVARLQQQLQELRARLDAYQKTDLRDLKNSIQTLRQSLPEIDGREVASALDLLEKSEAEPLAAPEGVEIVLRTGEDRPPETSRLKQALERGLETSKVRVYTSPAATASPSARATVMQVVERARSAGAALAVAGIVVWTLFNDWAAVGAAIQAERRGRRRAAGRAARLLSAGIGVLAGATMALVAGMALLGREAWIWPVALAVLGAVAGWLSGWLGHRLSPVDADAVEAARAMSMEGGAILETVVAPAVRPWLLSLTSSRRPPSGTRFGAPPAKNGRLLSSAAVSDGAPATFREAALAAYSLVKYYGAQKVLDGLSLSVTRGETVVIMGQSGCGKSTLLRCFKGLIEPDAGSVRIFGQDLWSLPDAQRRALAGRVGLVFQRPQLIAHLSVLQNVALAALGSGASWPEAYERAWHWLSVLEMARFASRRPAELSGGEGQRVAIARALAAEPDILLWDEPTSQLDPMLAADLLDLMEELIRRLRTTMLVVTHQPRFGARVAHRLVLMDGGRVVEAGPPRRVLAAPASDVGRRLARLAAM
ncbi:MAG: ATP-binding cassette domain-containing protein [Bacillota bacterium]